MAPEATQEANINVNPHVVTLNTPSQFVNKVSSLPIVNSAFDVAKHIYDGTKERYLVVEKVEGLVENLVPQIVSATSKATPAIVSKGLHQLDSLACTSLDMLEQRVPLLKEHPSQIAHVVSEKAFEGVVVIDHLVEKALVFSEHQIDYILPANGVPAPQEQPQNAAVNGNNNNNNKQKLASIARAQTLGANISKRLAHQLLGEKNLLLDIVRVASGEVEKQLGRLKVNFDAGLNMIHEEDVHLRRLFETYTTELRAGFAHAREKVEKMTQATVLETTLNVLEGLSKNITNFVNQTSQTLQQLAEKTNDPILKKCLEGGFSTLTYFQEYSLHLAKYAAQFTPVRTRANQPNEVVFGESAQETSSS